MERSTISNRSIKLFTLSGIHNATHSLLSGVALEDDEARVNLAADFWTCIANQIPDWTLARERKVSAADLRQEFIHSHTLALAALARVGNALIASETKAWKGKLKKLSTIDWSRSNRQWEGRAMNAGRLSKRNVNVTLTGNLIKTLLDIPLTVDEQQLEKQFNGEGNVRKKAK
jgi:DNA sulfur modification protein DndB